MRLFLFLIQIKTKICCGMPAILATVDTLTDGSAFTVIVSMGLLKDLFGLAFCRLHFTSIFRFVHTLNRFT